MNFNPGGAIMLLNFGRPFGAFAFAIGGFAFGFIGEFSFFLSLDLRIEFSLNLREFPLAVDLNFGLAELFELMAEFWNALLALNLDFELAELLDLMAEF